jgi:hypothetical protein
MSITKENRRQPFLIVIKLFSNALCTYLSRFLYRAMGNDIHRISALYDCGVRM